MRYLFLFFLSLGIGITCCADLTPPIQDSRNNYEFYKSMIDHYYESDEDPAALEELRSFLQKQEPLKPEGIDYAWGYFYSKQYEWDEALMKAEKALVFQKNEPLIYRLLSDAYFNKGDYVQSADNLKKALAIYNGEGDKAEEAVIVKKIGICYWSLGDYEKALDAFKEALSLFRVTNNRSGEGDVLNNIGVLHWSLLRFTEAAEYYTLARACYDAEGNEIGSARIAINMGIIYSSLNDYEKALDCYSQASTLNKKLNNNEGLWKSYKNMGNLFLKLSDNNRALEYYNKALLITRQLNNKSAVTQCLQSLANVYAELQAYEKALLLYEEAFMIIEKTEDRLNKAKLLNDWANIIKLTKDYDKALDYYNKALTIYMESGDRMDKEITLHNIAEVYEEQKRYTEAIAFSQKALAIQKEIKEKEGEGESLFLLGKCFFELDELDQAYFYLSESIHIFESLRSGLRYEEHKIGVMEKNIQRYNKIISLLYEMYLKKGDKSLIPLSFIYSESSRARALLDLLTEAGSHITEGIDPELKEEEQALERDFASVTIDLQNALLSEERDTNLITLLEEEQKQILSELEELKKRIVRTNPQYAGLKYPRPVNPEEIKKQLQGRMLIEYKVTDEALYIWSITKEGYRLKKVPVSSEELGEKVMEYRNTIATMLNQKYFIKKSRELYELLLAPVIEKNTQDVIIVPDGALFYLPFETLLTEDVPDERISGYKELPYFIKASTVFYTPSGAIAFLSQPERTTQSLFALGDPLFNEEKETEKNSYIRDAIVEGRLNRLEYSGEEVKKIAALFPGSQFYLRKEATEEKLKTPGMLNSYKYIHLATHGFINETRPYLSGIILSRSNDSGEDGILLTREIFNLKIQADLVVLSACNTGVGAIRRGEGLMGFSRAWHYAGASAILVSLWSVNDESTSYLMEEFYKELSRKESPGNALRKARLKMMTEYPHYEHPFYWAPFILSGSLPEGASGGDE